MKEIEKHIKRIIENSEPSEEKVYPENKNVFLFTRKVLTLKIKDKRELKRVVRKYFDRWEEFLMDNDGNPLSFEDVWSNFLYCQNKVKFAGDALLEAIEGADRKKEAGEPLPICNPERFSDAGVCRLIRVCNELQQKQKQNPFYISSYTAATIMEKSQPRAYILLQMLISEKVLKVVKKGNTYLATRYKLLVGC